MKILILGTAPGWEEENYSLYDEVWGFQAHIGHVPLTRCYEIHNPAMLGRYTKTIGKSVQEYLNKPASLGDKFHIHPDLIAYAPDAKLYDFDKALEEHGYIFTNTISWIMADAIRKKPKEIRISGVNMQIDEEYGHQKPSCWYMIGWGRAKGIKVTTGQSSTLLSVSHQYGMEDQPEAKDTFTRRLSHTEQLLKEHNAKLADASKAINYYNGCRDTLEFMMRSQGIE